MGILIKHGLLPKFNIYKRTEMVEETCDWMLVTRLFDRWCGVTPAGEGLRCHLEPMFDFLADTSCQGSLRSSCSWGKTYMLQAADNVN